MKMLTMENKSQPAGATNSLPSNSAGGNQNPSDPALHGMQSQLRNQGQPLSMPLANQSQSRQQLLTQNLPNTTTQSSADLPSALSSMTGINQNAISNIVNQGSNLQNMSGISQNSVSNSVGQGVQSNMFANSQRQQIQGRPQQVVSQQHQQQSQGQQQLIYQQQLQHQLLKQKMQQGNIQSNLLPSHMQQQQQQQQQALLQPNQMQPSQQSLVQISSSGLTSSQPTQQTQPSLMQSTQPGLQQNQQSGPSVLQQQSVLRQQQQTSITQQSILPSQQQQQLTGQQSSSGNMQQNQLLGQKNSISDISQQQQQRLLGQQNNLSNMQQQQPLLGQQNSIASLHQQQQPQLGPQSNVSALQQQQQLLGPGLSNMQQHQHSMHMMQHSKVSAQQHQAQPTSSTLLPSQGQQSQSQPPQQQLMSQLQSQPAQLQQQLHLQQQPNSLQREMQQRMQTPGSLLPPQNAIEQQKQMFQSQRGLPEAPSSSMDSTSQTGHTGVVDWQEDTYQKIKSMKELYFLELNEMYQKINLKFQQHDALLQQPKQQEQFERLRYFKNLLERMITFLQLPKSNIPIGFKDKLPQYEKQIIGILSSHRLKKPGMPQQQGQQQPLQQPGGQSHSMTQQLQSQIPQLQQHDNHVNQMQPMNLHPSRTSMQPATATGLQQGSMPLSTHLGVPTTQQGMMSLQPSSNLDSTSGNAMSGMIGSLQQNTVNAAQQANINTLSQSGQSALQPNMNPLQQSSNMLQHQHLKQEQLMQTQQLKQQYQQRQMHQQLMQQQQQQQQQQQKQQQSVQLQPHQMPQLHQMSDANELKVRPGTGLKPVMFPQHHPSSQRPTYHHQQQQLKMGAPFPISSPQFFQAQSPQISQHSSPQIDQQSLLTSIPKSATPMQSANSPFIVPPSPSTPLATSPLQGDPEKQQSSGISSISNAGNMGHQQTAIGPTQAQSLAIGTPGISASPLLAEFSSPDGNQGSATMALSGNSSATERPLERLIKAVKSMSPNALCSSLSDIGSVVSMVDRIAGSAPGNGSRAAVGEDLVAMTKCRLQARNFMSQDGSAATKKMRRQMSAMPLNVVSSVGSVNDSFKQLDSLETSELESTATSRIKRHKVEASHALLEEIREINQRLIDTVVEISDEDVDLIAADGKGAIVKCSYNAVALSPNLKSQYASAQTSPILPLRLIVPANYPNCSPVLLDKLPVELSKEFEDLSVKARLKFSISLRGLSQPMSLGEMARTWDICARKVVTEYAQQNGGGSFSSRYGTWEKCVST